MPTWTRAFSRHWGLKLDRSSQPLTIAPTKFFFRIFSNRSRICNHRLDSFYKEIWLQCPEQPPSF